MIHLPHPFARASRRRAAIVGLVAALVILCIECVGFNLPFWRTLGASTDSVSARNTMGSGLERTDTGALRVTDPTKAWLETKADGTSDFARVDTLEPKQESLNVIHLRVTFRDGMNGVDGTNGTDGADGTNGATTFQSTQTLSPSSTRSLFIRAHGSGVMRVWVEEAKGSIVPIEAVRANVRVPFSFDPARVALMAAVLLLAVAWRPGSRLWRIPLDTSSRRQRLAFFAMVAPFAAATIANVAWQIRYATPLSFHEPGGYTYDIDPYGHLADALLNGRVWLDLPVPDALAAASDPYDVTTRGRLLAEGVSPLYWDYAYYDGHWYSYFGVVPAILLFAPYRALTGCMMSSATAVHLLMFVALVFVWLLVIRLIRRLAPGTSLAATSLMLAFVPVAADFPYLAYRTNFYSVPFAASLMVTAAGLWLWLGAQTSKRPLNPADRWRVEGAPELSLPRLGLGAACIAVNFGCRPTFCLAALLGIPLFWPQIRAMVGSLRAGRVKVTQALRAPAVVVAAALVPLVPLAAYNRARFGSFLEFGNDYQFTVTDMTTFRQPSGDILPMVGYYLLLPLRLVREFPFIAVSPTPLAEWAYAEPVVGGLFVLCPLLVAAFALPAVRRRFAASGLMAFLWSALALAFVIVVFDASSAGIGWRYMGDFGWLFAIASLPALLHVTNTGNESNTGTVTDVDAGGRAAGRLPARVRLTRLVVPVVLYATLLLNLLCLFTIGRSDEMLSLNPGLFHDVASWFAM